MGHTLRKDEFSVARQAMQWNALDVLGEKKGRPCETWRMEPVKEKYYQKEFFTKFYLRFKQPSKNTCNSFQIKIESSEKKEVRTTNMYGKGRPLANG